MTDSHECTQRGRLLLSVIEERAAAHYQFPFASLPRGDHPHDGFRDVSYQMLKRAIDHTAFFLDQQLGQAAAAPTTFGFIGPYTDWRYILLALATMKTGHVAFFPSPRNSIDAHLSLIDSCGCSVFLRPATPLPLLSTLVERRPIRLVDIPSVDDLLDGGHEPASPSYPYAGDYDVLYNRPCLVLHTSGSTGIPKPIFIKQGWFTSVDVMQRLEDFGAAPYGLARLRHKRAFWPFPNFHGAAITSNTLSAVFLEICTVLAPATGPPSASVANAFHQHANVQASFLPPSVLKDLAHDPHMLENLSKLEVIYYGGSPVAEDIGRQVAQKTHLVSLLGITEAGLLPFEETEPEDWAYLKFGPHTDIEFRLLQEIPDRYEMVVVSRPRTRGMHVVFNTFPDLEEWSTKDIYTKHPTKPDLWHYEGRSDDIIVLSNGEKLNPLSFEQAIEGHGAVRGALVVGAGRFQTALLLEPFASVVENGAKEALLDQVWPCIAKANEACAAHGRIERGLVLVTSPDKPFSRAGKGSIQRRITLAEYHEEIERLYSVFQMSWGDSDAKADTSSKGVRSALQNFLNQAIGMVPGDNDNLFSYGLDSLHVMRLTRLLRQRGADAANCTTKRVYDNCTLAGLVQLVESPDSLLPPLSRVERMTQIFDGLCSDLVVNTREASAAAETVVLLTGSTGSLGSYLLDELIQNTPATRIYCLNRRAEAESYQSTIHAERGLTTDFQRVSFWQIEFTRPRLGLSVAQHTELLQRVTHVIANAWTLNFNIPLASFVEGDISGVAQLIRLCTLSRHNATLAFISSIGVVQSSHACPGEASIAEELISDFSASPTTGYAEAKHICENLVNHASQAAGFPACILRVGQIAGPVKRATQGLWKTDEWLPSILMSAQRLGQLPSDLGPMDVVDWIPVDIMAAVAVELVTRGSRIPHHKQARTYHLVNPQKTRWKELVPTVLQHNSASLELVSFADWVTTLERLQDTRDVPSVKILDFFRMWITQARESGTFRPLRTADTERNSLVLQNTGAIGSAHMTQWMQQWRAHNVL